MPTNSRQRKPPQKQPSKVISSPEASNSIQNSPFLLPRPIELSKQHPSQSFNLFDDFTFSHAPTTVQENPGWSASFDQLQHFNQNNFASNYWIDSVIPRFGSLNLHPEEARSSLTGDPSKNGHPKDFPMFSTVLHEKAMSGQRAKMFGSMSAPNQFQPVIWPEKGFPFYSTGPSNVASGGVHYPYGQIPGVALSYAFCPIPYPEPWAQNLFDNRAYFDLNQHHCLPSNCTVCMEAYTHRIQAEHFNLTCYNQYPHHKEFQVEEDTDYQQQPESNCQPQAIKGRRKHKFVPKVNSTPRVRKPSESQEITKENNFIAKPTDNIPKGARPILSAKK